MNASPSAHHQENATSPRHHIGRRIRVTSTGVLYFTLAIISLAAFAMSFAALRDLAKANEMAFPGLFPLIVDAAAIGFAVAAFKASSAGRTEYMYSLLVIAFTALSAALNVAHVWQGAEWAHFLRYGMHALPPIVAFFVLECLLIEVRHANRGVVAQCQTRTIDQATEDESLTAPGASDPDCQPRRRGRRPGSKRTSNAPTNRERAAQAGVPLRTFYRHLSRSIAPAA